MMQSRAAKQARLIAAAAAILLMIPLAACASQGGSGDYALSGGTAPNAGVESAPDAAESQSADGATGATGAAKDAARSVISTGSLTIEVADPRDALDQATALVDDLGGYVESRTMSTSGSGIPEGANLTVRVPQAKLDEAFAQLGELGRVLDESRSAEDVTAQHVDLQARVASLETSVARLTELMAGSATTGELIEAESALAARQAELDSLKAQLKLLEDQVDESTIWVSFTTRSALPGGPSNFWEGLVAGWESIMTAGAGALVLLGILLPWLAIIGVVALAILLIVRTARRRRRRDMAGRQPPPQQAAPPQQTAPPQPPSQIGE